MIRFMLSNCLALLLAASLVLGPAHAAEGPADPLASVRWPDLAKKFFGEGTITFDERIKVTVPSIIENQAQVPVTVDARALTGVVKLVVIADLNPIEHVLTLTPASAVPYVSLRMKVEQATPVRAAAQMADGTWRIGGVWLDAAGGGCSAPAMARKDADWSTTVGQAQGKLWREADGLARLRLRVRHPMDTGLGKDNTPAFFIERLELKTPRGERLAELELFEPVAEDPTVTLMMRLPASETAVDVSGRDNNGSQYRSRILAPWQQSRLAE